MEGERVDFPNGIMLSDTRNVPCVIGLHRAGEILRQKRLSLMFLFFLLLQLLLSVVMQLNFPSYKTLSLSLFFF